MSVSSFLMSSAAKQENIEKISGLLFGELMTSFDYSW